MKLAAQLALILMVASIAISQEPTLKKDGSEARKIYRVSFLMYEMEDGKRINERTYTVPVMTVDGNPRDSGINVGDRLPIQTKEDSFTYIDIGLSIDCNVTEQADKLIVSSTLTLSSIVPPDQRGGEAKFAGGNPVVRQIKQRFTTLVAPDKPTVVTSIDDINSKKRLEVEVTATRM